MEKQKTPLCLLEDWIYNFHTVNGKYPSTQEIVMQIDLLKEKEKEIFKSIYDNGWTNCNQGKFDDSNKYFETNLTQE